jgi:hypothetical protein
VTWPIPVLLFICFTGYSRMQTNIKNGERHGTATAYLRPVINRPNLHISLNTMATKVCLFLKETQSYTCIWIKWVSSIFSFVFVLCHVYSGVKHIMCCVFCFVCLRLVSCVPNVASFSWLLLRILSRLFQAKAANISMYPYV